jgi:hypothetical protein
MRAAIRAYRSRVLIEFSPFDSRHRRDFDEATNDAQNPLTIRDEDDVDFVVWANDPVRITLIDRRNHAAVSNCDRGASFGIYRGGHLRAVIEVLRKCAEDDVVNDRRPSVVGQ